MAGRKITVSLRVDRDVIGIVDNIVALNYPVIQNRTHLIEISLTNYIQTKFPKYIAVLAASAANRAATTISERASKAAAKATKRAIEKLHRDQRR